MRIGELSQRTGLAPSAIRYYEAEGLLPPAERVNGRRQFDDESLQCLAVVRLAKSAGFTIGEIRTLLKGFPGPAPASHHWHALARRKLPEVDALISRGEEMRRVLKLGLECECVSLDDCGLLAETRADAECPAERQTG